MKQFGVILRFEFSNYFANKAFLATTFLFAALISGLMFLPRIIAFFQDDPVSPSRGEDTPVMLVLNKSPESPEDLHRAFTEAFPNYMVQIFPTDDISFLREQIASGQAECAFVLESLASYTYYVDDLSLQDNNTGIADEALLRLYQQKTMEQVGVPEETIQHLFTVQIQRETQALGKNQVQSFLYAYVMVLALYMVILIYGQMVATGVAAEKSSRAMELLITSAKPVSMMFGKIIAACMAGLTQLLTIFGAAFLFYQLNASYWDANGVLSSLLDLQPRLLAYMLIFFLLGFLFYAFLFGAAGSAASKVEEASSLVSPIILLFALAFMAVIFFMSGGRVDDPVMVVFSFLPFTSPMAMFVRIAMSSVPLYQIFLSISILLVSVLGVGVLAAKIYRVGVLLYGAPPKLWHLIKALRQA